MSNANGMLTLADLVDRCKSFGSVAIAHADQTARWAGLEDDERAILIKAAEKKGTLVVPTADEIAWAEMARDLERCSLSGKRSNDTTGVGALGQKILSRINDLGGETTGSAVVAFAAAQGVNWTTAKDVDRSVRVSLGHLASRGYLRDQDGKGERFALTDSGRAQIVVRS